MQDIIVCYGCDERLANASNAMRHHANEMHKAIELAAHDSLTDEQRKDYRDSLVASFNDAQSAWDAYREHLAGHLGVLGVLPALRSWDAA